MVHIGTRALAAWAAAACCAVAQAQSTTQASVSGSLSGGATDGTTIQISFACTGIPNCTGSVVAHIKDSDCSNALDHTGRVEITGLDLTRVGALQGTFTIYDAQGDQMNADGTCSLKPRSSAKVVSATYVGSWDGSAGALNVSGAADGDATFNLSGPLSANVTLPPPVFPMTVTSSITPTQASASAQIQFRPEDVGKQGSVFVFAMAPSTLAKGAVLPKRASLAMNAQGATADGAVKCVLAQLDPAGQLVAASASNLQPFSSGVLSAQGQSVSILNNVPTPSVAGATFFVGYGSDASSMIDGGVNRSAVTVPSGDVTCNPQPPQTGWWWNPAEDGRGFSIEVQGNDLFMAAFLYDASGRATWVVSSGRASLNGAFFTNDLYSASHGQTLGGAYPGFPATQKIGTATLLFDDPAHGTLTWPGGSVPIQRQPFVPDGLAAAPLPNQPQNGWWWNAQESGRGFFLEWQGAWLDMAGYMYDDAGNPVWYITAAPMQGTSYANTWWTFGGGQTLTGPWQQNHLISNNVAPVTVQFTGPDTALMTLPNGRTTALTRQQF